MKKKNKLEVMSIRLNPDIVKEADKLGLQIPEVTRDALEKAVKKKVCPCCQQLLKTK